MKFLIFVIILAQSEYVFADALSDRLEKFSMQKISKAKFIETWSADYLDEPLVTKGKLLYKSTGILKKTIESPEFIIQTIEGSHLSIFRNDELSRMLLTDEPTLAAGIYALRDILEGNKKNLQERFELDYNEQENNWVIALVPKEKQVAQKIMRITLRGKDALIKQMRIDYRNGDQLITDIFHVK